jgi:hypothetical protein
MSTQRSAPENSHVTILGTLIGRAAKLLSRGAPNVLRALLPMFLDGQKILFMIQAFYRMRQNGETERHHRDEAS